MEGLAYFSLKLGVDLIGILNGGDDGLNLIYWYLTL